MTVTAIVPCRDGETHLAQTLGSLLEQTSPPAEVLVVDDGSSDASPEIARRFVARWPAHVRLLRSAGHGAPFARNLGADQASGDALWFVDADDVAAPDTLAGLVEALAEAPDGVALAPWSRLQAVDGRWVRRRRSCRPRRAGEDPLDAWLTGWYHPTSAVLWSREAFERAGRWDERLHNNQDGDLVLRALVGGTPMVEASRGELLYRRHEAATSLSDTRTTARGVRSRFEVVRKVRYRLELEGELPRHRHAVARAFLDVAALAEVADPALARRCRTLAALERPALPARLAHRAAEETRRVRLRGIDGVRDRLERRRHARPGSGTARQGAAPDGLDAEIDVDLDAEIDVEIDFGQRSARAALDVVPAPASVTVTPRRPLVSVLVPTYNRVHLLTRALDSALRQTMADLEVLVVDDGSTDGTQPVVANHPDPRVRYLRQVPNQGVSAARNRGIRAARGDYLAFLDSDDEWFPDKLARQMRRFAALPASVAMVYAGVEDDDGLGNRRPRRATHQGDLHAQLLRRNVVHGTSSVVLRREVVATVGFFDESIPAIEDYEYWLRVARFFDVEVVPQPLSRYHDPADQPRKSLELDANLAARDVLYGRHRGELRRAGVAHLFLLESARRHRVAASGDLRTARHLAARACLLSPTTIRAWELLGRTLVPDVVRRARRRVRGVA
ncbi:glycosyltransferase family 2 protein [Egicoccus halophilus]|nr:glycosyltransferase [Egicoccus halophilus]